MFASNGPEPKGLFSHLGHSLVIQRVNFYFQTTILHLLPSLFIPTKIISIADNNPVPQVILIDPLFCQFFSKTDLSNL